MTKKELFKKYKIDESHKEWSNRIDNWMSVEVYRVMHNGKLPPPEDVSVLYICDFLDKCKDFVWVNKLRGERKRDDFGSLYLTSKKLIYSLHIDILAAIKEKENE